MTMPFIHEDLYDRLGSFYPLTADIKQATQTRDSTGDPVESWATVSGLSAVACRVMPTGGGERRLTSEIYQRSTHVILLAGYYAAVEAHMRAVVSGVTYAILLVEHDSNSTMTKLVCEVIS
jgi:head-tail adaptor